MIQKFEIIGNQEPSTPLWVVTYNLDSDKERRERNDAVLECIRSFDDWEELSESCYIIATNKTNRAIHEELAEAFNDKDQFSISRFSPAVRGQHFHHVVDFLARYFRLKRLE
jgi:hypothetical protein